MDELALGRLGSPHGVSGHIKLTSFSGESDHLLSLRDATLKGNGRTLRLRIESMREAGAHLLVKFAGYDSPEDVTALAGLELWAPRGSAAPLEEGQYYYADLSGCRLVAGTETVGTVITVCEGGGGDMLEIGRPDGSTAFVPFRKEFIGTVDIGARQIELLAPWVLE